MDGSLETAVQGEAVGGSALADTVLRMIKHHQAVLRQEHSTSRESETAYGMLNMLRNYFSRPEHRGWLLPTIRHEVCEYLCLEARSEGLAKGQKQTSPESPPARRSRWRHALAYAVYATAGILIINGMSSIETRREAFINYTYTSLIAGATAAFVFLAQRYPDAWSRFMRTHHYTVHERDLIATLEGYQGPIRQALEKR